MHFSVNLTVPVIVLVVLLNSAAGLPAPRPQWSVTVTTLRPLGFRGYLAEFQRINNEVTAAVIRGDDDKVRELSKRLEELREQSKREAALAEQNRLRIQKEYDRRQSEERQRRYEVEQQTRRKKDEK